MPLFRRNVDGTGCAGVRSSTLALDHVELRPGQHVGRKRALFPRVDADQRCGSAESRLLLLLSEHRFQLVQRLLLVLLVLLVVVDQFRQLDQLLVDSFSRLT